MVPLSEIFCLNRLPPSQLAVDTSGLLYQCQSHISWQK